MNSKKKKWTALLSAFLLVCSILPMSAAAATTSNTGNKRTTTISAACAIPDVAIEVEVPSAVNSYLNPKSFTVKLGGSVTNAQIVTETAYVKNNSEVPISVSASITGSVKSGSTMTLRSDTTKNKNLTAKQAFVFFQMQAVTDPNPYNVDWDKEYDESKHIVVTTSTKTKKDFITLAAAPVDEDSDPTKCYGAFRLSGDCVTMPTDAWTTKDSFTAKIVFTVKALPYDTEVE
jgi:hypothetical protein